MKKSFIAAGIITMGIVAIGCGGGDDTRNNAYMPDMAYSRAYETYTMSAEKIAELQKQGIFYNTMPVEGTIARGEMEPYYISNDTTGYAQSSSVQDPLPEMDETYYKEAERLYLVNCAVCHGSKLDGNGPLWKGGDGPYPAAPRNLLDDYSKGLSDGTMYHVITYGKGLMGSYAHQVNPKQRWMLVKYMRSIQSGSKPAATDSTAAAATGNGTVTSDSAAMAAPATN
ncbi:MAG: cytochrome c [Chitinophagaceae bacterium]|jgi:mono/diheme cytochrome c family protein|nr:cytochrome c [Chitinophagaceae bacterium]